MSAFNVGKKVSAAVRILQRKRDASARATHLVGKKYPLITYEKALLSQATGGKFPSVTFIERKQMSTKTSIKRIALVAAAALTLGGFSVITAGSANAAATWNVTSAISGTGANSTTATTSAGSIATVALYNTTLDTSYQVTTTGSSILTAVATTAGGTSSTLNLNATNVQGGVLWTVAGGDTTGIDTLTVQVTSLVAGTTYINVTPYVSGVVGTAVQIPVAFVTAGSTAISATNSTVTVVKTATNCDSSVLVSTTYEQA
jgi:hypothetical protein